ncbi:hypothetical protein KCU78_g18874, partial [Aureobasidium melanogenum]
WATSCKLERFDELEKELGDKKELSEVYFEGNPLQKSNPVLYRNKVRLALPQVSKIDATYVRRSCLQLQLPTARKSSAARNGHRLMEATDSKSFTLVRPGYFSSLLNTKK